METPKDPVSLLVFQLSKLPGVGEKSATRLAYYILKQDARYAEALSAAILNAKQKMGLCSVCFTLTDSDPCRVCASPERRTETICVVEKPSDVFSIDGSGTYRGLFHVLHGVLSPLDGIGPEDLKMRELLARLHSGNVREVIVATNPSVEGEATALYLARLIKPMGIRVSRLAYGIPVGGMIEYTDRQTLGRAIENRMEIGA